MQPFEGPFTNIDDVAASHVIERFVQDGNYQLVFDQLCRALAKVEARWESAPPHLTLDEMFPGAQYDQVRTLVGVATNTMMANVDVDYGDVPAHHVLVTFNDHWPATVTVADVVAAAQRPPLPQEHNACGVGLDAVSYERQVAALLQQVTHERAPVNVDAVAARSEQFMVATRGRWNQKSVPDRFVPGDVNAILGGILTSAAVAEVAQKRVSAPFVSWSKASLGAVPVFVPAAVRPMLEASAPPEGFRAALRLPHRRTLVLFEEPLTCPDGSDGMPFGMVSDVAYAPWSYATGMVRLFPSRKMVGMLLHADNDGHLLDHFEWVHVGPVPQVALVAASRAASQVDGFVWNVVALMNVAGWKEPDPVDLPDSGKALKKALKSSSVRKALERGGNVDRLVVVDLERTAQQVITDSADKEGSGRTVKPHFRRGHWRQVRCGPRDGWWHEGRFVGSTIVNEDQLDGKALTHHRMFRITTDTAA